jgi:DNA-binding transcriptional ArsR family regulator
MTRRIPLAVIGPHDLTERTCQVAEEFPTLEALPYSYDHESETESLVMASRHTTAALLFTGVVPFRIAESAGLLDRPAAYISYTGASLYRALLRLVLDGHAIDRFSIDTLTREQVTEALEDAGLPTDGIHIVDYGFRTPTAEVVADHLAAHRKHGTTVAITCLRSAFEGIGDQMVAVRLSPALQSIRVGLSTVLLESLRGETAHAQVAIGIVDLDTEDDTIARHSAALGGSVVPLGDGTSSLLITTRGLLLEATSGLSQLPLLDRLAETHQRAHIGFGVGRSAADAEVLARSALRRARALGPRAAAVALSADRVVDLQRVGDDVEVERPSLPLLAQRSGMRQETLTKLRALIEERGDPEVTAGEIAEAFGIEQRAGRRILTKLVRAGLAEIVGSRPDGGSGRPPLLYRVAL